MQVPYLPCLPHFHALQFDEVDGAATHILAFTASSASSSAGEGAGSSSGSSSGSSTSGPGAVTAVGTLRLFGDKPHDGHMGRVAIVKHARGKGWGKLLMRRGHEEAAAMGYSQIVIHAQEDKQDFYKKLGYEVTSPEVFYEENIPHVRMAVQLKASA